MKQIQVKRDYPGNAMQHALLSFSDEPEWSVLATEIGRSFEISTDKVAVTYINSSETFTIRTQNALETFYEAHYKPGKLIQFVVKVPGILSQQAQNVHDKAWGKEWPHRTGQIKSTEPPDDCEIKVPKLLDYDCFIGIKELTEALYCPPMDVVDCSWRVQKAPEILGRGIGKKERAFIITGQPSIGKTTFLLYLLLYCLKRKLPTTVQFNRWKQWKKYSSAICLVSELPELLEIAAIVKVGPLIRTVLSMQKLDQPTSF
ncbi:hypothetical protein BT96DRAFT_1066310 [Gymnopus androsaceus JB14]|uniref:Uncharacterized protein n=1 Tax=Gymnopus androsaceus JB14 TaxID=1447944 RepID=A0A6A4GXW3_9AGAR|nr:hypothetical protein BT96DRAFT_1066310 [Gymnopus androsaceus JB14]